MKFLNYNVIQLQQGPAFIGDIALDEEDLRLFQVDRVEDLTRHTEKSHCRKDKQSVKRERCIHHVPVKRKPDMCSATVSSAAVPAENGKQAQSWHMSTDNIGRILGPQEKDKRSKDTYHL
ncbi:hypothetical protein Chor_002275 [Crotalus horridus]